jgi:hypothetical protein
MSGKQAQGGMCISVEGQNRKDSGLALAPAAPEAGIVLKYAGTAVLALFLASVDAVAEDAREIVVMGWLEGVFLKPWNLRLTAKLDTGAKTSSLNAENIQRFQREGSEWVRFAVSDDDDTAPLIIERPLARTVYIKEHRKDASRREVVTLDICKNGRTYATEFTLVDRSNFNYPVLLGRSFLKSVALVDASQTFRFRSEDDPCAAGVTVTGALPAERPE